MNQQAYIRYFKWQNKKGTFDLFLFILAHFLASLFCLFIIKFRNIKPAKSHDFLVLYRLKNSYLNTSLPSLLVKNTFAHAEHLRLFDILMSLSIADPKQCRFSPFYVYECYASYLIKRFNPKIVITERNGALFAPILKHQCNQHSIPIVHFASSILTDNYRKYSMVDYNYYFMYGQSSFNNINQRAIKFGQCQVILAGSLRINQKVFVKQSKKIKQDINANTFLLVGSGPGYELQSSTENFYRLIINFVAQNNQFKLLFKPHPRSDLSLWQALTKDCDPARFKIIDYLNTELQGTKLAFCGYTNAILDLALIGITPVLLSDEKVKDVFDYELFFGKSATTPEELNTKITDVLDHYDYYKKQSQAFIHYHLASHAPEKIIKDNLQKILQGKEPETTLPL